MAPARRPTRTIKLRRLATEMRALRLVSGLTRDRVLREAGVDNATLHRIETARTRPQLRTLTSLLALYELDRGQLDYLMTLWREAELPGWARPMHGDLTAFQTYMRFEADSAGQRNYESSFVPGLLQTEDHVRAQIRETLPEVNEEGIEVRVELRRQRQALLAAEQPLRLWAIVDEAVLHRQVGGPDVHRKQLAHLIEMAELPHLNLQVPSFGAGGHPGQHGQFIILDFEDPRDTDVVYVDSLLGDSLHESYDMIRKFTAIFDSLRAIALSPADSRALVASLHDAGRP